MIIVVVIVIIMFNVISHNRAEILVYLVCAVRADINQK